MAMTAPLAMAVALELALFAGAVFAILGLGEILLDALWIAGAGRRDEAPVDAAPDGTLPIALFIPAWDESAVIAPMVARSLTVWPQADVRLYVGLYPNDLAGRLALLPMLAADPRLTLVTVPVDGPTTKGDCLNHLWAACRADAAAGRFAAEAVVIHDAEDEIDAAEPALYARVLARADYVQLPVVPKIDATSRWIGGHYADEFASAHRRDLPVRAALTGALPLAGVGCAIRTTWLERLDRGDGPFAADSLTEDYELGLRLAAAGATGAFVTARDMAGRLVATRAYFPASIDAAVRQKTRWMRGIALDGWHRLGWPVAARTGQGFARWMLWRDRRGPLAAMAVAAAYAALLLMLAGLALGGARTGAPYLADRALLSLTLFNTLLLVWRAAMRCWHSGAVYGWRQGVWALLRLPVSNIILIMSAWRALWHYVRHGHGGSGLPGWDKTAHRFGDDLHPAAAR